MLERLLVVAEYADRDGREVMAYIMRKFAEEQDYIIGAIEADDFGYAQKSAKICFGTLARQVEADYHLSPK